MMAAYLGVSQGLLRVGDGLLLQSVLLVQLLGLRGDEGSDSVLGVDLLRRVMMYFYTSCIIKLLIYISVQSLPWRSR